MSDQRGLLAHSPSLQIFRKPIHQVSQEDVEGLKGQAAESLLLECKSQFTNKGVARTVACFANTYGGCLLVGAETDNITNLVTSIPGIPIEEGLKERVKNVVVDGIRPVPDFQACLVELLPSPEDNRQPGQCTLVIEIPRSLFAHVLLGTGQILRRTSEGCDPVTDSRTIQDMILRHDKQLEYVQQEIMWMRDTLYKERKSVPDSYIPDCYYQYVMICPLLVSPGFFPDLFTKEWWHKCLDPVGPTHKLIGADSKKSQRQRYLSAVQATCVLMVSDSGVVGYLRCVGLPKGTLGSEYDSVSQNLMLKDLDSLMNYAARLYGDRSYFAEVEIRLTLAQVEKKRLFSTRSLDGEASFISDPCLSQSIEVTRSILASDLGVPDRLADVCRSVAREVQRCFGVLAFDPSGTGD